MRKGIAWSVGCALVVLLASGCAKKVTGAPQAAVTGEKQHAGSMLAYEHNVQLVLPAASITAQVELTRQACETARFGACNLLRLQWGGSSSVISLRIVPDGVAPLIKLAAQGGQVGQHTISADDLADAVGDNHRQQALLLAQQQRLSDIAARRDLGVADLITVGKEQADLENQLKALEGQAAGQQHRLDTNLVTLEFVPPDENSSGSRLRLSLSGMGDRLAEGTSDAMDMLGYGLPFLILAFPLLLLWRWLWRKVVRWRRRNGTDV
ncbi:DUF4349 domain-containing protein [Rhodanobacter sp. L36]|uniref:DUF4349 domain-containing protein n=1 Tax=Rhodanobacter sp. L36 TaxID=1747221 RepID=UPI00131C252C|nr:DUF4349 domain-containing protein [Rhodanobacter sp. L36]